MAQELATKTAFHDCGWRSVLSMRLTLSRSPVLEIRRSEGNEGKDPGVFSEGAVSETLATPSPENLS